MEQKEINLDTLFANKHAEPTETVLIVEEQKYVDFGRILDEVSYKLPKGYPTVVDGVFTEREEITIINEALEAEGLPTLPLPEANKTPLRKVEKPQIVDFSEQETYVLKLLNANAPEGVTGIDTDKDQEGESTSTQKTTNITITPNPTKEYTDDNGRDKINSGFVKKLKSIKGLNVVIGKSERLNYRFGFSIDYNNRKYNCRVVKPTTYTSTTTDVKEGFSLLFGYYFDYNQELPQFNANNVVKLAKQLQIYLKGKDIDANIDEGLKSKLITYLKRIIDVDKEAAEDKLAEYKKTFASFFQQSISHGRTFSYFFENNNDFYIERGELFNSIRKAGAKISNVGLTAIDKWCPGDVYFIRNGSEGVIDPILEAIDKLQIENKEKPSEEQLSLLSQLNSLFSSTFNKKVDEKTPIVAVSLKMANAQAGKLKSALKPVPSKVLQLPKTYNVEKTEADMTTTKKLDDFAKLTKKTFGDVIAALKQEKDSTYTYNGKPLSAAVAQNTNSIDSLVNFIKAKNSKYQSMFMEKLKFKYASYKMLKYIIANYTIPTNDGKEFDQSLKNLAAFGLGVSKIQLAAGENGVWINPPFFKVIANESGEAMLDQTSKAVKPQFYQPGSTITLTGVKEPEIAIEDSFPDNINSPKAGMKGLKIDFKILLNAVKGKNLKPQNDVYELSMSFRPNGATQITVELQKAHLA
jgi:hypothetical protein